MFEVDTLPLDSACLQRLLADYFSYSGGGRTGLGLGKARPNCRTR